MAITHSSLARMAWALVGVPIAFAAYCLLSYKLMPPLPFSSPAGTANWFIVFAAVIFSGVLAIGSYFPGRIWVKVFIILLYTLLMTVILFFVGLLAACMSGDCI
jgi:hypothetical protein